jgi:sigma-B regulation protein RsbU (phosphoserine phosphatase)
LPFIKSSEIWGGYQSTDINVSTDVLTASLYSTTSKEGKGGDIYYLSVCDHALLTRMVLADVVGLGKTVSDTSRWLYDSLALRINEIEGSHILRDLNTVARKHHFKAIASIAVITVNGKRARLNFSYAGHPPFFIKRKSERVWQQLTIQLPSPNQNLPIGVEDDVSFDEDSIPINSGDILFLYTDGVLEAPGAGQQDFGVERVLSALNKKKSSDPKVIRDTVRDALFKFSGHDLTHDDFTLMAIKII